MITQRDACDDVDRCGAAHRRVRGDAGQGCSPCFDLVMLIARFSIRSIADVDNVAAADANDKTIEFAWTL